LVYQGAFKVGKTNW